MVCLYYFSKKKIDKSKFSSLLFRPFFKIKIQPNMNEQEKKRQSIYDLFNTELNESFSVYRIQKKKHFLTEKELFKEKGESRIEPKTKRRLFNYFHYDD